MSHNTPLPSGVTYLLPIWWNTGHESSKGKLDSTSKSKSGGASLRFPPPPPPWPARPALPSQPGSWPIYLNLLILLQDVSSLITSPGLAPAPCSGSSGALPFLRVLGAIVTSARNKPGWNIEDLQEIFDIQIWFIQRLSRSKRWLHTLQNLVVLPWGFHLLDHIDIGHWGYRTLKYRSKCSK